MADEKTPPSPELTAVIERQQTDREALQTKAAEAQAVLLKWYGTALDAVKKDAATKGDLDAVLGTDAERQRMERDLTPEEKEKLSPVQRTVRGQYDQARAQQAAQQKAAASASLRAYLVALEGLEKRFTQKLDLAGAIAARTERAAAAQLLAEIEAAGPGTIPVKSASPESGPVPVGARPAVPGRSIAFFGLIDATDEITVQKGALRINHHRFSKPKNITINGQAWEPVWKDNHTDDFTGFKPKLAPFTATPVSVEKKSGRGKVEITQQPTAQNNWTLLVHLNDVGNGADNMELLITW